MDEAISLIFQGCKLARELEGNLQHYLSNNQLLPPLGVTLSESCDEIIQMFVSAKERLISNPPPPQLFSIGGHDEGHEASLHEWFVRSAMAAGSSTSVQVPATVAGTMQLDVSGSGQLLVGSSSSPSSQQRPRRRKDDVEKKTVTVAAPLMGNTEAPPEDGYIWRKYGQKEILGSRFPRSYYRCTHQKMYQCPAKKQVQRLNHDPYTFQVTYMGNHTCHMSSTAPSIAPPAHITAASSGAHQLALSGTPVPPWLDFNLGSSSGGGSSSSSSSNVNTMAAAAGSSGGDIAAAAGPPYLVAEMADAMFNSGSSSTNSMEFLFQSPQDKWDPEDNKKN